MQKHVNLVDLVKSFPKKIYLQKSASIQPRTSHLIFIILTATRDEIFTERSSPPSHPVLQLPQESKLFPFLEFASADLVQKFREGGSVIQQADSCVASGKAIVYTYKCTRKTKANCIPKTYTRQYILHTSTHNTSYFFASTFFEPS